MKTGAGDLGAMGVDSGADRVGGSLGADLADRAVFADADAGPTGARVLDWTALLCSATSVENEFHFH
ncbi:MAG: hypothetical protein R3F61_31030 [Myxococcota bacterium]